MFRSQEVVEYVRVSSQEVTEVQELREVKDIPEESHDAARDIPEESHDAAKDIPGESHDAALLLEVEVELLVHVAGVLPQAGGLGHVLIHAQTFPLVPGQQEGGGRKEAGGRRKEAEGRRKEAGRNEEGRNEEGGRQSITVSRFLKKFEDAEDKYLQAK